MIEKDLTTSGGYAMNIGATFTAKTTVTEQNTALAVGSGDAPVFATPMMTALMEHAAMQLAAQFLEEGQTTVGTSLSVTHSAATPVGMVVEATAVLTAVEGRILSFSVTSKDESGIIGEGTHQRAIVWRERFVEKTYAKKK